ncbi:MAG TPA: prepilin peptidase [Roseiflexaceae bacterium]|nr:prepilin peptidase [Roseiflexaceae bacterium]
MDPLTIVVFVAGLFLGSLLNIIVIRLPRERNLGGWPRCTRCGRALGWWQVLPLAGWLAQAGRARCCGRSLAALFPLIELMSGVVLAIFYTQYGLNAPFWYLSFVAAILIVTGAIDWLHRSIYTFVILGAALVVLIATAVAPIHSFRNALFGALVAGFVFVIFFALARILFPGKSSPFGLGDVYLGIFIGAAVGLTNLLPSLFYGMVMAGLFSAALIVAKRTGRPNVPEYISYGTFLCLGALGYLVRWGLGGG